jgi:hypothetical protein
MFIYNKLHEMTKQDETYRVTNNKTIYYYDAKDNNGFHYKLN